MNRRDLALPLVLAVALAAIAWIASTAPDAVVRSRFLVVPGGWWRALAVASIVVAGVSGSAYAWGWSRRPTRAWRYAVVAGTHTFLVGVTVTALYPVVYLLSVSFNRKNALVGALPREGPLWLRAGIFPDPSEVSLVQYRSVLEATHLTPLQIGLAVATVVILLGIAASTVLARVRPSAASTARRARAWLGVALFPTIATLVLGIGPEQFYKVLDDGTRIPVAGDKMVLLFIRNTLVVSGTTGLFAVLIATTAGYAFARLRFEGRYTTLLTFVFVQMFPGFMALVAIYYLMSYLDLLNTFTGLILAYSGGAIAFSSWIFKGYLESVSPSLEEAALVDGSTRWGAFVRIILPVSLPMLLFIFLLQFIGTYSEFILANTLLIGTERWTVGIGLRSFTQNAFDTQWGAMAASAVLGSIPILTIFYAFQDSLTAQTQAGGVKG